MDDPDLTPPATTGWREELDRFMTAEEEEKIRMLLGEPDEGVQGADDEEATGDDDLTDAERAQYAARFWKVANAPVSPEALARARELGAVRRLPRRHEEWCGDVSLGRPVDECTCAITPEMQREQNLAAEVLRHAAQHQLLHQMDDFYGDQPVPLPGAVVPAPHQARRDDDVDRWLKRKRNELDDYGWLAIVRSAIEDLLDDYRLHADTGTPLDAEVSER